VTTGMPKGTGVDKEVFWLSQNSRVWKTELLRK